MPSQELAARSLFLAVVGPGFITANVDNDAGVSSLLARWAQSLLAAVDDDPITVALVVVQEMRRAWARDREGAERSHPGEFGFRVTFLLMLALVVTNFGNVVRSLLASPAASSSSDLEVHRGAGRRGRLGHRRASTYSSIEKIFLVASGFYVCTSSPDCWRIRTGSRSPRDVQPPSRWAFELRYLFMVIGLVARQSRRGCSSTCRRLSSRKG